MGKIYAAVLALLLASVSVAQDESELAHRAKSILENRCVKCHNPEKKTSGLVLTTLEGALQGGSRGSALVPSHPDQSLLLEKILTGEMPADGPIPQEEIEVLTNWIKAGAPWEADIASKPERPRAGPDWWSLQPLRAAGPPVVEGIPEQWNQSPIDRFIYAKLREKGLQPSSSTDRSSLIRRATFDLLGMPPTPEEVKAFVQDPSPDAYEKLIDRLLSSPHYGERWGRHWLDVVRFGESHGYEQNHLRDRAWPYRDYVIRSLNEDKPFNQMILEQLAGDQIAAGVPEVEAATGFLVAGMHDTVGIQNVEGALQQRANDLDDMITATATAFLGLTVNCARCHDHKFDPIKQSDYYRVQAAFAGVLHEERELATTEEKSRYRLAAKPLLKELEGVKLRIEALQNQAEPRAEAARDAIAKEFLPTIDSRGTEEIFSPTPARFVRMTVLATYKNGSPALDELEVWTAQAAPRNIALESAGARITARATRSAGSDTSFYRVEHLNDGKFDRIWISGERGTGQVTLEFPRTFTISRILWSRDRLGANLERHLSMVPTRYVFEVSTDGAEWTKIADAAERLPYVQEEQKELFLQSVFSSEEKKAWNDLKKLKRELEEKLSAIPKLPTAYIGRFRQPEEPTHVLKRGNPTDKGEAVAPGSLSAFELMLPAYQLDAKATDGERRLALARWITDDRNPLTARVIANRIWNYHFGKGIVGTPSDFGFNGERPTHPELLDWLARRLQQSGWKLKPLHKEIMLSATYRQSSLFNLQNAQIDGEARFLWRFPPRRLEAEAVRDSILAVSGQLDRAMGGPGFRLYNYVVDNVATYYPLQSHGPETYRRSVYHQAARSVAVDLLGPYDCPDSALPAPSRAVTTTPLQALSLLNNPFIVDQAKFFARRLVREAGDDPSAQVERAYGLAFGRHPKTLELEAALQLIREHGLWVFCRSVFNTNEFIYVM